MDEINIPSYFLCPISLEIMRDPVTLSTGITYDRENIEKWVFSGKNDTCPLTKQVLVDMELIPNHTLRRLIQAWCTLNASYGIERIPTPKPLVDKAEIIKLMDNAMKSRSQMASLCRLKEIVLESDRNKRCMEAAGIVECLASIVTSSTPGMENGVASDEALSILYSLQISVSGLKTLVGKSCGFLESLVQILCHGSYQSRPYAILLLKMMFEVADPIRLTSLKPELFVGVVNALRDQNSHQAHKALLQILIEICSWGRNRIKAVEAGAVLVLIELLLETNDKKGSEMILIVLDQLCACAEGRAQLLNHGAGIAIVSKKILRVSQVGSERAIRILSSISKCSSNSSVLQEMLQVGVASKLCLVLQAECTMKTKAKAREILTSHSRVWKKGTCIPPHLLTSGLKPTISVQSEWHFKFPPIFHPITCFLSLEEREKSERGVDESIFFEYFNRSVTSDLDQGFLCYLSQLDFRLMIPLRNLAKDSRSQVMRKESLIDIVAREGTEFKIVLGELKISRFKRANSRSEKV
ncbi:hypothetical protein GIB67_019017 [Kingdonia uniflora]|uniref:U-box domain-containing protein n=1 Tax=Kingdonia uniflora TaxID=39325 RepID=A0A7J7MZY4_9MAGN|nr:hypothetical protein GIB67_019017 [Kingdonia uniflora]